MSFRPPVGAIAFGKSGAAYPVVEVYPDRIVLMRDGATWAVNPVAVVRWELAVIPTALTVGQKVRLKGTTQTFTLIEIYDHFMGWVDGDLTYEQWARLVTEGGKPAHWKLQQLETIE